MLCRIILYDAISYTTIVIIIIIIIIIITIISILLKLEHVEDIVHTFEIEDM